MRLNQITSLDVGVGLLRLAGLFGQNYDDISLSYTGYMNLSTLISFIRNHYDELCITGRCFVRRLLDGVDGRNVRFQCGHNGLGLVSLSVGFFVVAGKLSRTDVAVAWRFIASLLMPVSE